MIRFASSLSAALAVSALVWDCKPDSKKTPEGETPPPVVATSATTPVPHAMPIDEFDASLEPLDGKTPLEQARIYESRGQLWMAQMALERKALGPDGTKAETELLGYICHQRDETDCVKKCEQKLGRRLKLDGGAMVRPSLDPSGEHREPKSALAAARDLILKKQWDEARPLLEPRVLDGKASKEEVRLLKQVCQGQGDRMCVALCDAKLK